MSTEHTPPTVVSLFAGTGGSSLGYKLAGYTCRLAVEWDDHAAANYRKNFPATTLFHGDVAALTDARALAMAKLAPGELDVLDGSPPCQGFSTMGLRLMDDPRNGLFREYTRLLRAFRPKVLVMENVSGMVKGKMKLMFADILQTLKGSGYKVSVRLLNAAYLGVPQRRERLIFIGVREDLEVEPSHPVPFSRQLTIREALGKDAARLAAELPAGEFKPKGVQIWKQMRVGVPGINGSLFSYIRVDPDRACPTITKSAGYYYGRSSTLMHWATPRGLSGGELRRLASFPDDFIFDGSYIEVLARIGNCVPPLMMKAVAEHIRKAILARC